MTCVQCGNTIIGRAYTRAIISSKGKIVQNLCKACYDFIKKATYFQAYNFGSRIPISLKEDEEMPKAILSYEALQLDSEGIPTEGAYKLKLEGDFKRHIEPIVKFIKASIPSSDRTYDPTTYEWAFHEKYYPLMEQAFKGSHFQVSFTVRKEDFVELKRKQAEFAKQAGQSFAQRQVPVEEDIQKFIQLLLPIEIGKNGDFTVEVKSWNREEAIKAWKKALRFYHPDLHPERAAQASELNEVWSRLKEGYYIK